MVFVAFYTVVSIVSQTMDSHIHGLPGGAQVKYHDSGSGGTELPGGSLNHLQHLWPQGDPPGGDLRIFIDEITNFLAVMWAI